MKAEEIIKKLIATYKKRTYIAMNVTSIQKIGTTSRWYAKQAKKLTYKLDYILED